MQQRYYDPVIGRFLSADPAPANGNTGSNFNRYKYASNNPYRFSDPDGRYDCEAGKKNCAAVAKAVKEIKRSFRSSRARSLRGRARVAAVMRHLGTEGDGNGVVIRSASGNFEGNSETFDNGQNVININFDAKSLANSTRAAFDDSVASTLVHEASHGFDQKMRLRNGSHPMMTSRTDLNISEIRANTAQAYFYRGLNKDAPFGHWTRAGGVDNDFINSQADWSVDYVCSRMPCDP